MSNDNIEKQLEAHVQQLIDNAYEDTNKGKAPQIRKKNATCKACGKTETWSSRGHFPNGCRKWRDANGLICNGRLCGKCNRDRAGKTMRKTRSQ